MKKLLALVLAAAMLLSFAACGEKEPNVTETTTAAEETSAPDAAVDATTGEETDTTVADVDASEAVSEEATSDEAVSEETSVTAEDATAEEENVEIAPAPTDKAAIISLYNDAVNSAYNAKAGFKKARSTDNEKADVSLTLKPFMGLVYQFMGVGAENKYTETVTKGQWDTDTKRYYLRKSTLAAGDVTGATCKLNANEYTVVLNVKGGNSKGSEDQKFTNAPIDKCGICVGNEDKGYYDHKTGEVIYDAIAGTYAGASIEESYKNAKVTAVIDAETGNLKKLTVEFDINVSIDISIGSGTATATTHIVYTDFKY